MDRGDRQIQAEQSRRRAVGILATSVERNRPGIERYGRNILRRLVPKLLNHGIAVTCFLRKAQDTGIIDDLRNSAAELVISPFRNQFVTEHLWLPWYLARVDLDLVYNPHFFMPLFTSKNFWVSILDVVHLAMPETVTRKSYYYYRLFYTYASWRARKILTISDFSKREIVRRLGVQTERVNVIPSGVDPIDDRSSLPSMIRLAHEKHIQPLNYYLSVSTIHPRKNFRGLIKAYKLLLDKFGQNIPDLILAGRLGWLYDDVLAEIANCAGKVRRTGYVSDDELAWLYVNALATAYPSFYEGFGLPVLESMACGTPVIVSQATVMEGLCDGACVLVDPYDPCSIMAGLARFLKEPNLRQELVRKGNEVVPQYTWDKAADMLFRLMMEHFAEQD